MAGLTLNIGIDRFMSEARAITNLIGNAVAVVTISACGKTNWIAAEARQGLAGEMRNRCPAQLRPRERSASHLGDLGDLRRRRIVQTRDRLLVPAEVGEVAFEVYSRSAPPSG